MTSTIVNLGDSQTDVAAGYGVRPSETWGPQLADLLTLAGCDVIARTHGIVGDTSLQLLTRSPIAHAYDIPDLISIAIGVNDPPSGTITTAQTAQNVTALVLGLRHCAYGAATGGKGVGTPDLAGQGMAGPGAPYVAGQANLPATGIPGQRYVVMADSSTTGGVAAYGAGQAVTITGSLAADGNGNKISVWEYRYPQAGERGWGRVATVATAALGGTPRFAIVSSPYLNWTAGGGDTLTTPDATRAATRTALQSAVTALGSGVVYVDVYAAMKARIQAGTDPDFTSVTFDQTKNWHYTQNNQHYSRYGHAIQAQTIAATLPSNWKAALS